MAESTTPRFGLAQWTEDTDTVNRPEFNTSFAKVEELAAIHRQGLSTARPAPGTAGTYYYATDTNRVWLDIGYTWRLVGGNSYQGLTTVAPNVSSQALTVNGAPGQSSDLYRNRDSEGIILSAFDKNGALKSGGVYVVSNTNAQDALRLYNASLSTVPIDPSYPAQVWRGLPNQTGNIAEVRVSNGDIGTRFNNLGHMITKRGLKDADTDATADNEYVTRGQLNRSLPQYTFVVMTLSQYNGLLVKDPKTLYVIVG